MKYLIVDTSPAYYMAIGAHGSQTYGIHPYVDTHCRAVVGILMSFGFTTPDWTDAGWLHDAVEDTHLTIEIIRHHFGELTANLVWAVSGFGENRKARNADMHRKIIEFPRAAILKTADRIANMESARALPDQGLYRMYMKEFMAFEELVRLHIPADMLVRLWSTAE